MDPFSLAASVASVVAFAGAVSKTCYQFFQSIHDAPAAARDLVSALYTLNIALSQVQGTLLDPRFVAEADDQHVESLQNCLTSCTTVFDAVRTKVERSGLGRDDQKLLRKAWESVKASFNDDEMREFLRRIEREKTTLLLVIDIFSARLHASILTQVHETKAIVQKHDRYLKDIHVFCQWAVQNVARSQDSNVLPEHSIETTSVVASSVYDQRDVSRLLQSSESVLSLTLGDMTDESIEWLWEPSPSSKLPIRRMSSTLLSGLPPQNKSGLLEAPSRMVSVLPRRLTEFSSILDTVAVLAKDSVNAKSSRDHWKSSASGVMRSYLSLLSATTQPFLISPSASSSLRKMLQSTSNLNSAITDDLRDIEETMTIINNQWVRLDADETLRQASSKMYIAAQEYAKWAQNMISRGQNHSNLSSSKLPIQALRAIIEAEPNEKERQRLKSEITRTMQATKAAQETFASNEARNMQVKQLAVQEKTYLQLQQLMKEKTPESSDQDGTNIHAPNTESSFISANLKDMDEPEPNKKSEDISPQQRSDSPSLQLDKMSLAPHKDSSIEGRDD